MVYRKTRLRPLILDLCSDPHKPAMVLRPQKEEEGRSPVGRSVLASALPGLASNLWIYGPTQNRGRYRLTAIRSPPWMYRTAVMAGVDLTIIEMDWTICGQFSAIWGSIYEYILITIWSIWAGQWRSRPEQIMEGEKRWRQIVRNRQRKMDWDVDIWQA